MVDVVGATTSLVNSAKDAAGTASSLLESGPASALSSVSGGVSEALGSVSSFLGSIGGNPGGITKLPIPNPLSQYASYDYVITLSALSWKDHNFPDQSYKAGKRLPIICSSASKDPENRVQTKFGKFEFYLDNLRFESAIGLNNSKATNVTTVQFDVIEPYSVGLFPLALQTAAKKVGIDNWRSAFFLITIEFRGNTEDGRMVKVPNATRHIPIRLTNMTFKANEQGSTYGMNSYASNSQALLVQYANLKTDVTIKGKTVQEVLQTGEQSLQAVINRKEKEAVKNKTKKVADEIVILFPKDTSSAGSPAAAVQAGVTKPTIDPKLQTGNDSVFAKLGVVESSVNSTHIQKDDAVNLLGSTSMGYDLSRLGDSTTTKEDLVIKNGIHIRGNVKSDPAEGSLRFAQDTDIPTVINTVLMLSDYPRIGLDSNNQKDGYIKWWRIDTQVYCIDTKENLKSTGDIPKIIVYRVVPYEAHLSALTAPNQPADFTKVKKEVCKSYDYIFTGKNTEILKFNIDYSISFANLLAADNFRNNADVLRAKSASGEERKEPTVEQNPQGVEPSSEPGVGNTTSKNSATQSSLDGYGGGSRETAINRAARVWHDAITNPLDMINLDMEITGDPYWIVNSGLGNYTSKRAPISRNLTSEGSVNWQSNEVHIYVNFKNPLDINQATGLYDFKTGGYAGGGSMQSDGAIGFKGLYKITTITSHFRQGEFRQTLQGFRRRLQESPVPPSPLSGLASNIPDIVSDIAGKISSAVSSIQSGISSAVSSVSASLGVNSSTPPDASSTDVPNP